MIFYTLRRFCKSDDTKVLFSFFFYKSLRVFFHDIKLRISKVGLERYKNEFRVFRIDKILIEKYL